MITVDLLADSITPAGNRLTTFLLTYPRFIHAEIMTHRAFSRNAASSRAIPIQRMVDMVHENPAMPEFWGANQKGMQATAEVAPELLEQTKTWWTASAEVAIAQAKFAVAHFDLHKQIANRVMEPFSHITVVLTSGERGLRNFFGLRAHADAQPEFQVLAYRMLAAWLAHTPLHVPWQGWHIPAFPGVVGEPCARIATAHCARVSYLTHDGKRTDFDADLALHDRLAKAGHWSAFEHCAQAVKDPPLSNLGPHWLQYRKTFLAECRIPSDAELQNTLATRPEWVTLQP